MNTLEAIYQRRSVKGFDPNHKLTPQEELKLLEATIQAPTSFNLLGKFPAACGGFESVVSCGL